MMQRCQPSISAPPTLFAARAALHININDSDLCLSGAPASVGWTTTSEVARSGAGGAGSRGGPEPGEQNPKINQEKHLSQLMSESPLHTRASLYIRDVRDSCMTRCGQRRSAVGGPRNASVGQSRPHSHTTETAQAQLSGAHRHTHPSRRWHLARSVLSVVDAHPMRCVDRLAVLSHSLSTCLAMRQNGARRDCAV